MVVNYRIIIMSSSEIAIVKKLQHYIVKKIQGFPRRTRSDMCEYMVGCYKPFSHVIIRQLLFLHKRLSLDINSTTGNIFVRRYMQFVTDRTVKFGFIPDVCNILWKYGLHCSVNNALISHSSLPSQYCWKKLVKNLILTNEHDMCHESFVTDEDFCLLRTLQPSTSPCIAYDIFDNKLKYVTLNIAKLWIYAPRNPEETYPRCTGTVVSNLSAHFVVECSYYKAQRDSFIRNAYYMYIFSKSTENAYSTFLGCLCDLVQSNVYKCVVICICIQCNWRIVLIPITSACYWTPLLYCTCACINNKMYVFVYNVYRASLNSFDVDKL